MGNAAASCAPSIICSSTGVIKVMSGDGTLEFYTRPVKAAELMLENPGHFVCDSSHLKVGHRIPGLLAEEELDRVNRRHGQQRLYFLLPMEMLYSVLTNEELTSLSRKASKALKQQGHQGGRGIGYLSTFPKIFPASFGEFCLFPNNHSETKTNSYSDVTTAAVSSRSGTEPVTRQRSWIPALETIVETPPRRLMG